MSAAFWDKRSEKYDANVREHDDQYRKTIDAALAQLRASDIVLDLGCASGEQSLDIAPHVQRLRGIDTSAKMIELAKIKARERGIANAEFDAVDIQDSRLEPGNYNAIVALNVIHLLDDVPAALSRAHALLADEGRLISKTPCLSGRGWLVRAGIGLAQKLGLVPDVRSLTSSELESLIAAAGFEIVESKLWDRKHGIQWVLAQKI